MQRSIAAAALAALFVLAAACTTAKKPDSPLHLPGELAAGQSIAVDNKAAGDFRVVDHHRGLRQGWDWNFPSFGTENLPQWARVESGESHSHNRYRFALASDGQPRWACLCRQQEESSSTTYRSVPVAGAVAGDLECALRNVTGGPTWTFRMHNEGTLRKMHMGAHATLSDGTTVYDFNVLDQLQGIDGSLHTLPIPLGLVIKESDRVAGAIDLTSSRLVVPQGANANEKELLTAVTEAFFLSNGD